MDKDKQIYWIVGVIILVILLFPYLNLEKFIIYDSEESLKYQIHNPGICPIAVKDNTGVWHNYNIIVTVRTAGNNIYQKFDGTPQLPPTDYAGRQFGSNGCSSFGLSYYDWNDMWKLVDYGIIEGSVDYCPTGVKDPDLDDGIDNLQCNQFCKRNKAVCISGGRLAKCSIDGVEITYEDCDYGCENNACRNPTKTLTIQTDKINYNLGEDIIVIGTFSSYGIGISSINVIAQLTKNGAVIENGELQSITDTNGVAQFTFSKPTTSGETTIQLIVPNYEGRTYIAKPKIIQITGNYINYSVATYSYTQYSSQDITFTVTMKDLTGADIIPAQIENLQGIVSLTQGTVQSTEVVYNGKGEYEIISKVDGSGIFVGKLSFEFEGLLQYSPIISISIKPSDVNIDLSKIPASADLNEIKIITITVTDALGVKLDPDNLYVHVSFPDGTTVKDIPFTEINRIDLGVYEFSFIFNQVEKYTFDVYADYLNYARASARRSVAVGGTAGGPGIPGIGKYLNYIIYGAVALILYYVYKGRKKR